MTSKRKPGSIQTISWEAGRKTHENTSAMQTQDVLAIVRGAFRAMKLSMAGGRHVVIRPSGIKGVVRVGVKMYDQSSVAPRYNVTVSLPRTKIDKAAVNALAGELMAALKIGKPWWQQDTLWCDGMEVRLKSIKPKPTTTERVLERESHARKMLARAERDAAKVQARVDRWQTKVTYYDKRNAKALWLKG